MRNSMGYIRNEHYLYGNSHKDNVLGDIPHNLFYYVLQLIKEMAELPLALKGLLILGWSITGWGILLDTPFGKEVFVNMPLGFKYSIWSFSLIFIGLNCLRLYEKYRKEKIANDDAEIDLRIKRGKKPAA